MNDNSTHSSYNVRQSAYNDRPSSYNDQKVRTILYELLSSKLYEHCTNSFGHCTNYARILYETGWTNHKATIIPNRQNISICGCKTIISQQKMQMTDFVSLCGLFLNEITRTTRPLQTWTTKPWQILPCLSEPASLPLYASFLNIQAWKIWFW